MSDKDDSVEMSAELTPTDHDERSVKLPKTSDDTQELKNAEAQNFENENINEPNPPNAMGQLKSKIKNVGLPGKPGISKEVEDEIEIADSDGEFMCGVVEGFYGRPWTTGQRKELFRRMKTMGMNTYLYGPKDDYKHRLYWRDLYSKDESDLLRLLMESAAEYDVLFIYAISPGLDMVFASQKELECLRNKLLQVQSLGCKAFALLFDDIDPLLCATDKAQYSSAGSAQASVTNQMYIALGKPRFLFCPTEYCNSMAIPDVPNSKYLNTVGKELDKRISVMWTGPKVVSKYITVESIKQLTQVLRRKVVIWDNIHANDYDPKRMFLGPYKGRSTHLIPLLGGVLTNPNCELESNYIAMYTLASWWKCYRNPKGKTDKNQMTVDEQENKMEENHNDRLHSQSDALCEESTNEDMVLETAQPESTKEVLKEQPQSDSLDLPNVDDIKKAEMVGTCDDEAESKGIEPIATEAVAQSASPSQRGEGTEKSPVSSGVSSLAISDDSDTDSDYSSHDGYYSYLKHQHPPIFDHGDYDPDEALNEAVKSWLPYFSSVSVPLGKPIARSGPPLGMLLQNDISVMSSAVMGPSSSTTSVLRNDPIVSTSVVQGNVSTSKSDDKPEAAGNVDMEGDDKCDPGEENDVEMTGDTGQETGIKNETRDVDMPSNSDSDMVPSSLQKDGEHGENQDGDVPFVAMKDEAASVMDTDESMPCDIDPEDAAPETSTEDLGKTNLSQSESTSMQDTDTVANMPGQTSKMEDCDKCNASMPKNEFVQDFVQASTSVSSDSMTLDDVQLAVELYYLPYEHGKFGLKMVHEFIWLRNNIKLAVVPPNAPPSAKTESMDMAMQWMEKAIQFEDHCSSIRKVCNKLLCCSNRALLYDMFPYFWDMKGVVSMLSSYVKWMGQFYLRHQPAIPIDQPETESTPVKMNPTLSAISVAAPHIPPIPPAAVWLGSDPEPWVFRGGLSGEFQRLLPLSLANDLFCQAIPCSPPTSSDVYTIRPYLSSDEKAVYNICLTTGNDGTDFADDFSGFEDLPGERLVGGLLTLSPQYCFVVEDMLGICGYLVGTTDAKSFWRKYEISFLLEIKEKYMKKSDEDEENLGEDVKRFLAEIRSEDAPDSYAIDHLYNSHPALMQIAVHRRVTDPTIASSMTVCMLSALKSHGVHGVHTTVRLSDCFMPDQYCRLGFREIRPIAISPPSSPRSCVSNLNKEDSIIVFGRNF